MMDLKTGERTIEKYPLAYSSEATPYHKYRFDGPVREFCDRDILTPKNHLRVGKCVVVGDIAVGKTCLINRFGYNVFSNDYKVTIGVDFDVQKFSVLDIPFNLQIWDTAGMERFKCMVSSYYRGAHVAIIVFDMANVSSLSNANKWLTEVLASNQMSSPLIFLVGTKKELLCETAFQFVESQAITIANQLNAEYWSVSAKTGENVEEFFHRVAVLTFESMIKREICAARIERPPVKYTTKFIKLKKQKSCKKFWSVSCARL